MADEFVYYNNCPICGSTSSKLIEPGKQISEEIKSLVDIWKDMFLPDTPDYMLKDHAYFTHSYEADLLTCSNCGHVTRSPRLSPIQTFMEYSQDYYHPDWLAANFEPYYLSYLGEVPSIKNRLNPGANILEVGSHVGGFMQLSKELGFEATGIDIGECVCTFAKNKGFNVFNKPLEDMQFPDEYFDAVFIWLCFEMIPYPDKFLNEVYRILRPGGWVFISIPNGEFIKLAQPFLRSKINFIKDWTRRALAFGIILGFTFQFGYTPKSIKKILEKTGFNISEVQNQFYIPVTPFDHVPQSTIKEKQRSLALIHYLSQFIYYLSFKNIVLGPWMKIIAQKISGDKS